MRVLVCLNINVAIGKQYDTLVNNVTIWFVGKTDKRTSSIYDALFLTAGLYLLVKAKYVNVITVI